ILSSTLRSFAIVLGGMFATPDSKWIAGTTFLSLTIFACSLVTSRFSILSPIWLWSCSGSCAQVVKGESPGICRSTAAPGVVSSSGGPASTDGSGGPASTDGSGGPASTDGISDWITPALVPGATGGAPRRQNTSV